MGVVSCNATSLNQCCWVDEQGEEVLDVKFPSALQCIHFLRCFFVVVRVPGFFCGHHPTQTQLDTESLIECILENGKELMQCDRCSLFLVDMETEELVSYFADGFSQLRMPLDDGIAGLVAKTGMSVPFRFCLPRLGTLWG